MGWRLWPGVIAGLPVVITEVGAQQHPAMFSAPRGSSARSDVSLPRATSAVSPPSATSVWVTGPLVKVLADAPAGGGQSLQISAAQNEFESFQVHLRAGSSPVQMDVTVSDFVNARNGSVIHSASNVFVSREAYLNITTLSDQNGTPGMTPDPLIPTKDPYFNETRNAFPFTVAANTVQSSWIDVLVPANAASGYYTATVTVKDGGAQLAQIAVTLKVWNFALPSTATLKSAFGLSQYGFCVQAYGYGSDNGYTNCAQYPPSGNDSGNAADLAVISQATLLLDHRISSGVVYSAPFTSMTRFDAFYGALMNGVAATLPPGAKPTLLNGAKWTTVGMGPPGVLFGQISAQTSTNFIQTWVSHFTSNSGWLAALYDYTCDEPPSGCTWMQARDWAAAAHNASTSIKTLVTSNIVNANQQPDPNNHLLARLNIIVPIVNEMDPQNGTNQRSTYDAWLTGGTNNHLWWYQGCSSHGSCSDGIVGPAQST
jgi:hypothetical protein